MTKESQIVHENGPYWVLRKGNTFIVMKTGATHSVSDSGYSDRSLAIARADYLAKRAREKSKTG